MKVHQFHVSDITIPPNRQRREFNPDEIMKLAGSIGEIGLIHPIVVRKDPDTAEIILVAGERRLKALDYLWNLGETVRCGETTFPEYEVPCLYQGEMDPIDAFEMELEENIRRMDLTWQEKATATAQLFNLRQHREGQKEEAGEVAASRGEIISEIAAESGTHYNTVREEVIVAKYLDDPDIKKAKTSNEAFKILKRKEEAKKNAELSATVGATYTSAVHTLIKGDCLTVMEGLPDESFDVILTDPPYGMDAHEFGDSGGIADGAHFYDDSYDTWKRLISGLAAASFRLARPQAHIYIFCDIDRFGELKSVLASSGWRVFRTPIIWMNPNGMRAPWPESGPQRKYQLIAYAIKGNKPVTRIYSDVITVGNDINQGHPAQKPVPLLLDLLRRSVRPGDSILDPFCGSGSIFPACHELKLRATGIELDDSAHGLSAKRLGELK